MAAPRPFRDKVYSKLSKGSDLQLHIKVTKADGLEMVNLRDFVPSLKLYGRGVLFDVQMLPQVIEELQELQRQVGNGRAGVHAGQQTLPGMEGL